VFVVLSRISQLQHSAACDCLYTVRIRHWLLMSFPLYPSLSVSPVEVTLSGVVTTSTHTECK
jgi:hypothetical protein